MQAIIHAHVNHQLVKQIYHNNTIQIPDEHYLTNPNQTSYNRGKCRGTRPHHSRSQKKQNQRYPVTKIEKSIQLSS